LIKEYKMDKREFVQRFVIDNYNSSDNVYVQIEAALYVFNTIEETFVKSVASTDLWKNEQR